MIDQHLIKRLIIVIGYIALFTAIGFLLHFFLSPKETCFDGKKNQSEKDIDCGGVCNPCKVDYIGKEFIVGEKAFVSGGNNTYDVVVKISNPNDIVGASSFHYAITLKDDSGNVLSVKEGDDYILPADSKYVAQLGLVTVGNNSPSEVDFSVSDIKWKQLENVERPQLSIYDRKFGPDAGGVGSRAEGLVRNESVNDLKKIDIVIILRDEQGKILGVSTTQEENMRAGKEGDFALTWPYAFPLAVRSMEVDAQANVFDSQNFSTGF